MMARVMGMMVGMMGMMVGMMKGMGMEKEPGMMG